jgi:hypothetical protein
MKKLITAVTVCLSLSVHAQANEVDYDECGAIGDTAQSIMEARQLGVDIVKMLKAGKDLPGMNAIVEIAYSQPRYETHKSKKVAEQEFRTRVFLTCLESRRAAE